MYYLNLITGDADQLNRNNTLYEIHVSLMTLDDNDILAALSDKDKKSIEVFNQDYYTSRTEGNARLSIGADIKSYDQDVSLSLSLAPNRFDDSISLEIYDGVFTSPETLESSGVTPNTAFLKDGVTKAANEWYKSEQTLVLRRNGSVVYIVPLRISVGPSYTYVYTDWICYHDAGGSTEDPADYNSWEYDDKQYIDYEVYELENGYSVNDEYYVSLSYSDKYGNYGHDTTHIVKAVLGYYESLTDAANEEDIKDMLFSDVWNGGGFKGVFKDKTCFTVFDDDDNVMYAGLYVKEYEEREATPTIQDPLSKDTFFRIEGAKGLDSVVMDYKDDSYYFNGFQTVLLMDGQNPVAAGTTIYPTFFTHSKVTVYSGIDKTSGKKEESGVSAIQFTSGAAIQYSAAAENGTHLKNYWVTFLTKQDKPTLFINGINEPVFYDEEENLPVREVFLTEDYGNHHDIYIANIGSGPITNLSVELSDAENVALHDYWTIREDGTKTLNALTDIDNKDYEAKIRLVPIMKNGEVQSGVVSGRLTIRYNDGEKDQEQVIILKGVAGNAKIVTETVNDGVKFVPYSSLIQTSNMYSDDAVSFSIKEGRLPTGLSIKPNGEIYGMPTVTGEYTFTLQAEFTKGDSTSTDSKEYTISIIENTVDNVDASNEGEQGYARLVSVENQTGEYTDQEFKSAGALGEFVDLWLDGEKLTDGKDYTAKDGSTDITLFAQTFRNAGQGEHTISAEFRTGGKNDLNSPLKHTSQVYTSDVANKSSKPSSGGGQSATVKIDSDIENGSVSTDMKSAAEGKTVTITTKPDEGYETKSVIVRDKHGNEIPVTKTGTNQYTFKMPAGEVTIDVEYVPAANPVGGFVDVTDQDWFAEAVEYVSSKGLMVGVSSDHFAPQMDVSRGMIVTILYAIAGKPEVSANAFDDVPDDQYYSDAVSWAAEEGIVAGYGDGTFRPDDPVTREQVQVMFRAFMNCMDFDISNTADLDEFTDKDEISDYAVDAVKWSYAEGLVCGKGNGILDPLGKASRAEMAVFIKGLCMKLEAE